MRHPDWTNVTTSKPCPVCKRPNENHTSKWCKVHRSGAVALCPFTESNKFIQEAGFVHVLASDANRTEIHFPRANPLPRIIRWNQMVQSYCEAVHPDRLGRLAFSLGVTDLALHRLSIGLKDGGEWTFPMQDSQRRIVGIRIRAEDGSKYAVTGSKNGLFIPNGISNGDPLIICEGPTDTAAVLDMGFDAIGRASCISGNDFIPPLCQGRHVVILSDNDDAGRIGAKRLAESIVRVTKSVKVITPGYAKDAREWLRMGASRREVESVIMATREFR